MKIAYFAFILLLIIYSCSYTSHPPKEYNKTIEIFFCSNNNQNNNNNCIGKIKQLFNKSEIIHCALYSLHSEEISNLAREKGTEIILNNDKNNNNHEFIKANNRKGLMHNKFCIFDKEIVLTGSFNPSEKESKSANNLIIINSSFLASNYDSEFQEMKQGIYGKGKKVKFPILYLDDKKIENYFCPEDNCKKQVLKSLESADESIYFMTYSFTDNDIGNLILKKQLQGIEIKGFFDKSQLSNYSEYEKLSNFSTAIPNLHHKVFIIDRKTVITGSYNPSRNGNENNDENILIIENKIIAEKYLEEFKSISQTLAENKNH